MIEFRQQQIKCGDHHSTCNVSGGDLFRWVTHFVGLHGNSEIVSGPGEYLVDALCWLAHDDFKDPGGLERLRDYQRYLRGLAGEHGRLVEKHSTGRVAGAWDPVTFLGIEHVPFIGYEVPQPVFDYAGCVNGGWVLKVRLRWAILRDEG